jgi:hypothetical protein
MSEVVTEAKLHDQCFLQHKWFLKKKSKKWWFFKTLTPKYDGILQFS